MATYETIITDTGAAKIAEAVGTGGTVQMVNMAVGDGEGNPVTPQPNRTALVREVYRAGLNNAFQSQSDPSVYIFEMAIPAAEGGFTVREVGLFDADGDLIAYANFPATYKPTPEQGAVQDLVIQIYVKFSNEAVVEIVLDPNIIVASKEWVIANFLSLLGGTTGQIIRKKSNTDNDIEWVDLDLEDFNIVVNSIEEPQTLAANQTTVNWAVVSTQFLAVYIAGARAIKDVDFTVTDATTIELTRSYPADTPIVGVQNDPYGGVTPAQIGALAVAANLSDVDDAEQSRSNIGLAYSTKVQAEDATRPDRVMSPLRTKEQIDKRLASEAEAIARENKVKLMTPWLVGKAIGVGAVPFGYIAGFGITVGDYFGGPISPGYPYGDQTAFISPGIAAAEGGAGLGSGVAIKSEAVFAKRVDAAWIPGQNSGGMAGGIAQLNRWYAVFAISKADGTFDVGFDTDKDATNLMAEAAGFGFSFYRRIGWVYVLPNNSANAFFRSQMQRGDRFLLTQPETTSGSISSSTSEGDINVFCPPDRVDAFINASASNDADIYFGHTSSERAVNWPVEDAYTNFDTGGKAYIVDGSSLVVPTENSVIRAYSRTAVNSTVTVSSFGWIDQRGKEFY